MNNENPIILVSIKGGPGSGNWGHAGRPGLRGGSAPKGTGVGFTITSDYVDTAARSYAEAVANDVAEKRHPGTYADKTAYDAGRKIWEVRLSNGVIEDVTREGVKRNMSRSSRRVRDMDGMIRSHVLSRGGNESVVVKTIKAVRDKIMEM